MKAIGRGFNPWGWWAIGSAPRHDPLRFEITQQEFEEAAPFEGMNWPRRHQMEKTVRGACTIIRRWMPLQLILANGREIEVTAHFLAGRMARVSIVLPTSDIDEIKYYLDEMVVTWAHERPLKPWDNYHRWSLTQGDTIATVRLLAFDRVKDSATFELAWRRNSFDLEKTCGRP